MSNKIILGVKNETINLLKSQILLEFSASVQYLNSSSWCEINGYLNSASFLKRQSDEERNHMLKIFQYLLDIGVQAEHPLNFEVENNFSSFRNVFQHAMNSESVVTNFVRNFADHCHEVSDYSTLKIINWFVEEQIEEEKTMQKILGFFDLLGEDKLSLYHVDLEIGKM